MKFDNLIICGEELVSFEVGKSIKVMSVKLDSVKIMSTVTKLESNKVTANTITITSSISDLMNKEVRNKLNKMCNKNLIEVDSVDFTAI